MTAAVNKTRAAMLIAACLVFSAGANAQEKELQDYYQEASAFQKKGDWERAEAGYTKAIELNRSYEVLYYERGRTRFKKGDWDGAIQDLTKSLSLSPKNKKARRALCLRAEAFIKKNDFDKALADFEAVVQEYPLADEAYRGRGSVHVLKGKKEPALLDFNRAVELNPSDSLNYLSRAKLFFSMGRYEEAIADYDRALERDVSADAAYTGRGIARFVKSDYRGALSDFDKAVELNPRRRAELENFIDQAKTILKT